MAASNRRQSRRLRSRRQAQIVGNDGTMAVGQLPRATNTVIENALAINHPPPWTLKELKKKRVIALQSMVTAYNIVPGHRWHKQDMVKALFEYGQQQAPSVPITESKEEEQPQHDPS